MSTEQLKHIFEQSACLTPKQIKGYATGKMVHEEAHAVEVHLLSCPFCSDALEGVTEHKDRAVANLEKIDASFIAKHFGVAKEEIKISSKTTHKTKQTAFKSLDNTTSTEKKSNLDKLWKPIAAAAGLVGVAVIMWMMKDSIFPKDAPKQLAQEATTQPEKINEPEIVYKPATEDTTMIAAESVMDIDEQPENPATELTQEVIAKKAEQEKLLKAETDKRLKDKNVVEADAKLAKEKLAKQKAEQKKKEELLAANRDVTKDKVAAGKAEERSRMGNSFDAGAANAYTSKPKDDVKTEKTETPPSPAKKKIELGTARSGILKGDEAFNEGKYKKALKQYQKVMFDPESNQKDAATLMAAKCHIAMEEMMQARTLLNSLIKDNSTKKGEAAGLLNEVPKEEQ